MKINDAIKATAKGNEQAFSQLYRSLRRQMIGYALGLVAGDLPAAEDIVDEAFLNVWQKAGKFSGQGDGKAWLRSIVRNKAVDWLRKFAGEKIDPQQHFAGKFEETNSGGIELADITCDREWLRKILGELSAVQRETVLLFYYEEMPIAQIADVMECPENTVKTRLHHGRQKLRIKQLELEC